MLPGALGGQTSILILQMSINEPERLGNVLARTRPVKGATNQSNERLNAGGGRERAPRAERRPHTVHAPCWRQPGTPYLRALRLAALL